MNEIKSAAPYCNCCTLSNGLRVIHRPTTSAVAYCGLAIDAGTRDELPHEQGMAHFVEHMLFKGTGRRKAWHILNRMENVGGDLNAYTNKEETVVYAAFLTPHLERAVELLGDIVFHSTFPQRELERETEVIIDEIQSYEDTPTELIFDDFEELLFQGHPLGRNILGSPDTLKGFTGADAAAFTARYYHPEQMVFFLQGDYDFRRVQRMLERLLGDEPGGATTLLRTPPPPYVPRTLTLRRDTHQRHVMIGARAYEAHDPRRTALCLLNNLLGGPGMNSRLNVSLREQRGLVYTVESNITSYTDTGVFSIYFGCDAEDMARCIELTHRELRRLRDTRLTPARLTAAKKQLVGQMGVAADNNENNALGMAKLFLHHRRYETPQEVFARIDALTADQLLHVAGELFAPDHLSMLVYE